MSKTNKIIGTLLGLDVFSVIIAVFVVMLIFQFPAEQSRIFLFGFALFFIVGFFLYLVMSQRWFTPIKKFFLILEKRQEPQGALIQEAADAAYGYPIRFAVLVIAVWILRAFGSTILISFFIPINSRTFAGLIVLTILAVTAMFLQFFPAAIALISPVAGRISQVALSAQISIRAKRFGFLPKVTFIMWSLVIAALTFISLFGYFTVVRTVTNQLKDEASVLTDLVSEKLDRRISKGEFTVDELRAIIEEEISDDKGFGFLADEQGKIIVGQPSNIFTEESLSFDHALRKGINSAKEATVYDLLTERAISYQPVGGDRGYVVGTVFYLSRIESISKLFRWLLIFSLFGIAFVIPACYFQSASIRNPARRLARALKELAGDGGRLTEKIGIVAQDELGEATQWLNKLVDNLLATYTIINNIADSLIVFKQDGTITRVNPVTCSLLGYEKDDLIGKPVDTLFLGKGLFESGKVEELIREGSLRNHELTYLTKDREEIPVSFNGAAMMGSKGELVGIVGIVRDIRDIRKVIKELEKNRDELVVKVEERIKELKDAQSQLFQSAKMSAVGQLGAGVAHELNNPMGGILGYSQFILEKLKKPEFGPEDFKSCSRYIESIERESERCKKIVENLLKFSRRPVSVKPEPLDIGKAIEETLSITSHQLKIKNIKITTDIKPDLFKVTGVTNQLQQIFTNLILNAQQAMPEGGELKITAENISPGQVKMEFTDTGCGIPEEVLSRIFEPFFTTKEVGKGTGLGLSVVYQIIQDHKGTIDVNSQAGKGTTFTIVLPAIV